MRFTLDKGHFITDELKQIGNSFANVGRLVTGKGTKEISEEKPGVGLTRLINMPIKRNIAALRHHIEKVDRAMNKLDTISAGLEPEEKKAEKGEKPKSAQKPKKEENQKEKSEKNPQKEENQQEKAEKQPEKEKIQNKAEEKEKPKQKTEKEQTPEKNPPKKDMEKGAEKKERVSVKEKLSEMKAKSEHQKKEPEAAKAKCKEECL